MRKLLIPVLAVFLAALPSHAEAPWNDDVENAVVVSEFPATITADTTGATTSLNEEECFSVYGASLPVRAVWYRLNFADDVERITIEHNGDAHVVLWYPDQPLGLDDGPMSRWGCAYPDDPYPWYIPGGPMYMSVGASLASEIGAVEITVTPLGGAAPPNDVPYRATKIGSLPYTTEIDTRNAEHDSDELGCPQGSYVWYRYTPPVAMYTEISVQPLRKSVGATVAVYSLGEEVSTLGCAGTQWEDEPASVAVFVEAGVDVLIGVGAYGVYSVGVREIDPPAGPDDRANATPLSPGAMVPFDTSAATLEEGEPSSCGDGGSVWFALPPLARAATATATGGGASIAAMSASGVVACSLDGSLPLPTGSSVTHLQVRGVAAKGTVSLAFETPFGTQVSGDSPFPSGCDDPIGHNARDSEVEVHHAVDPNNPDHIVVAWQQDRFEAGGGANGIGAAVTFDGGTTWTTSVLPGLTRCSGGLHARATDPWVAVDADGTVYVISLVFNPLWIEPVNLANALVLSRSEDGGLTWQDPIVVAASPGGVFHDKETLTADPTTPGLLYAVWDAWPSNVAFPVFSRSEDGGKTWTPPVPLPTTGSGAGDQIAVLDDHTLVEIAPRADMQSITSRDRGLTWSKISRIAPMDFYEGPNGVRGGAYIPSVATDGTSVYVSWSDTRETFVARSDDAGDTWHVSRIGARFSDPSRFTTAVAVTGNGTVAVATYRIDQSRRAWVELATSADGGETWTEAPVTETWNMRRAPFTVRGYFLGDYFAMSGVSDDEVRMTFTAVPPGTEDAVSNVYSLLLKV